MDIYYVYFSFDINFICKNWNIYNINNSGKKSSSFGIETIGPKYTQTRNHSSFQKGKKKKKKKESHRTPFSKLRSLPFSNRASGSFSSSNFFPLPRRGKKEERRAVIKEGSGYQGAVEFQPSGWIFSRH